MLTAALPLGYLVAPPLSGLISDRFLKSNRRPMIMVSCAISAFVLFAVAVIPPTYGYVGAVLLLIGGISIGLAPMATLAVDIAGRNIAATSSGLLDAHGYAYAGFQAIVFSLILGITGSPWMLVFIAMGLVRVLSLFMIYRVRV
jgi:sugar phosphate permease